MWHPERYGLLPSVAGGHGRVGFQESFTQVTADVGGDASPEQPQSLDEAQGTTPADPWAITAEERFVMCLGCMFAGLAVMFPRVGLLIIWIFTPWVEMVFDNWFWPLLGLIFLPFATLTYILVDVATVGDLNFGGWLLVGLAALIDVSHWSQLIANRQNGVAVYNQYGPGQAGA